MASLKDVHELIHSLEKREKIQFNVYANALSGKAKESYINDYQCFVKLKDYDKDKLKTALNKVKKRKNLSESNTNLYHCILDSMLGTFKNKQQSIGLLKEIQDVEILFQKGLIEQSAQLFYKLKDKFKNNKNTGIYLHMLEFENQLLLHQSKNHTKYDRRIELIDEQLDFAKRLEIRLQFRKLKRQLFDLAGKVGTPRSQENLDKYLLLKDSEALSLDPSLLPQSSYADYYIVKFLFQSCTELKNRQSGVLILKEGLSLVQKEIDIKQNFVPAFLLARMIMQTSVMNKEAEEEAKESIEIFESIMPYLTSNHHQTLGKTALISSYLLYYLNFNKLNEAYQYLQKHKEEILDENNLALSPHAYTNYLACARICFIKKDYEQSLEFIEVLLAMKGKIRNSILPPINCLFLLNHYKLGNTEFLPYAIRSFYKSILKSGQLYEPEKALLSFFRKSTNAIDVKPEIKKLYDKLLEIKDDPFHASFFGNADYLLWLENEVK